MLEDDFRDLMKTRKAIHPEDSYGYDRLWEKETNLLSKDINATIVFLDNECTAEEFSWISEVFEDIADKTRSSDFINCLYRVAKKFPEVCREHNIYDFIESSESLLDIS